MLVCGIDVGFSEDAGRQTCCYCVIDVCPDSQSFELVSFPRKFSYIGSLQGFEHLCEQHKDIQLFSMDAPLTPVRLQRRPSSGRRVDKRFSRGDFSNGKRGPQPSSICSPKQGWPLYNAGMTLVDRLQQVKSAARYLTFADFKGQPKSGIIECIPKLTLSLLMPRDQVMGRTDQIDNFLFPLVFNAGGKPARLVRTLDGLTLSETAQQAVRIFSSHPRKYHEELGAFVAAFQAALFCVGHASIAGCEGDHEGYYVLPAQRDWHPDWLKAFRETPNKGIDIINANTPDASERTS